MQKRFIPESWIKNSIIQLLLTTSLLFACQEEESINIQNMLIQHEWEQVTGQVNNEYYGSIKQFYCLDFKSDQTCEIKFQVVGGLGFNDPVQLTTVSVGYELENDIVHFLAPLDTVYFGPERDTTLFYLSDFKVIPVNVKAFKTEPHNIHDLPDSPYKALITGVNTYYFQAKD